MQPIPKPGTEHPNPDRAPNPPRGRKPTPLIGLFYYLRWGVPIAVSFFGVAYIVFEQVVIGGHSISEPTVARTVAVIGLVGPALVWITLTWTARAAVAEAQAQNELAVRNAQARRRYDAMVALHETSLDIIAQLEREDLLNALLRRAVELLHASGSSLFLYDAERDLIVNIARYKTLRNIVGATLKPGEGLIGRVVQAGMPMMVNDFGNWDGNAPIFADDPESRGIGVPLKWRDQIIGGIVVLNSINARPFDEDDLWLLSLFADLSSIAIKNVDLHSEIKQFNQRLESTIAERTQELVRAKGEIAEKATQLQSLLAKTIHLQEEERARIARDMHDGVVQLISASRYEIQAAKVVSGAVLPGLAQEKLVAARDVLDEAEKEIRRVIYDLHPPVLDVVGLVPALQEYVRRFQPLSSVDFSVVVNGKPYRLPSETEVAVFRMIEEALHNAAVHAEAKTATVALEFKPGIFSVVVQDDGRGFDYPNWAVNRKGNHLGLLGMQERVENLGGKLQIVAEPLHGTRVSFHLPVQDAQEIGADDD